MMPREITDEAKRLARRRPAFPPSHILISATHTHTPDAGRRIPERSRMRISQRPPGQIARHPKANNNLEPAKIGWGSVDEPHAGLQSPLVSSSRHSSRRPVRRTTDKVQMNPGYQAPGLVEPPARSTRRSPSCPSSRRRAGRSRCWPTTRCTTSAASARSRPIISAPSPTGSAVARRTRRPAVRRHHVQRHQRRHQQRQLRRRGPRQPGAGRADPRGRRRGRRGALEAYQKIEYQRLGVRSTPPCARSNWGSAAGPTKDLARAKGPGEGQGAGPDAASRGLRPRDGAAGEVPGEVKVTSCRRCASATWGSAPSRARSSSRSAWRSRRRAR